jgi:hypothetical protein
MCHEYRDSLLYLKPTLTADRKAIPQIYSIKKLDVSKDTTA